MRQYFHRLWYDPVRFRLKPDTSNSHEFELHRPSNKGTKLLLKVIKAIIIIYHLHARGLGLCLFFFSELVCDLLTRRLFEGFR